MSDDLKKIYAKEGKSGHYFDGETPCELFRGQHPDAHKREEFILEPHRGFVKVDKVTGQRRERKADVAIVNRNGTEVVIGCRCNRGDFRGLSTFDKPVTWFDKPRWYNFSIPKGTELPSSLAVVRDKYDYDKDATHYTIAPKDDMPLDLFIQSLKVVASKMTFLGK